MPSIAVGNAHGSCLKAACDRAAAHPAAARPAAAGKAAADACDPSAALDPAVAAWVAPDVRARAAALLPRGAATALSLQALAYSEPVPGLAQALTAWLLASRPLLLSAFPSLRFLQTAGVVRRSLPAYSRRPAERRHSTRRDLRRRSSLARLMALLPLRSSAE